MIQNQKQNYVKYLNRLWRDLKNDVIFKNMAVTSQ